MGNICRLCCNYKTNFVNPINYEGEINIIVESSTPENYETPCIEFLVLDDDFTPCESSVINSAPPINYEGECIVKNSVSEFVLQDAYVSQQRECIVKNSANEFVVLDDYVSQQHVEDIDNDFVVI